MIWWLEFRRVLFRSALLGTSDDFRPLILRELSRRALELAAGLDRPSDLSLALTWGLRRDPLMPLSWESREAVPTLKAEGMSDVIDNRDAWRALRRRLSPLRPGA